jgi:glutathione peroxidase
MIKKITIVVVVMLGCFAGYVYVVNRNSKDMTIRQKILKAVYPVFMRLQGKSGKILENEHKAPAVPFHSLKAVTGSGAAYDFSQLKGKKVLIVNTASNCGYTGQYDELQQLYKRFENKLVILGFPANDFKEQEKGNDEEIAQFCKVNFGVTFPLMKKSSVVKSPTQNEVYQWLTDAAKNGWNSKAPSWNFSKYLVDENGILTHYFDPAVSPLSEQVVNELK